jgi:NAD(P)-dependent dehydrogenase (short-subunit alcohol dehydrogenase family)
MTQIIAEHRATPSGLLEDKVIVITGASSGIGADAARVFATEGAAVVLGGRSEERLSQITGELEANGARVSYVAGDVTNAGDAQLLIDAAVERYGRLDGAFNNAGISQGGAPVADISEETFDRLLAVNLKGIWLAMRAEIRAMVAAEKPGGAIVNTSSVGACAAALSSAATTPPSMVSSGSRAARRTTMVGTECASTRSRPAQPTHR